MATLTNFLKLYKPATNEVGWDDNMNANLDVVDGFVNQFMHIPNFVGAWTNATAYAVGQIALDTANGLMYRANVAHTSAAAPTTFAQDRAAHTTFWTQTTTPAQDSATAAANSAAAAATSATAAQNSLNTFRGQYYGAFASDPLTDPLGAARTAGDLYFNTTTARMRVFHTTPAPAAWADIAVGFDDAPTTAPTTQAYLRTGAHTWVLGVSASGGTINGDVVVTGKLGVGVTPPAPQVGGTTITEHAYTVGALTLNLYFSALPAPNGSWRYITAIPPPASNAAGNGAALLTSGTNPADTNRFTTLFTTLSTDVAAADGIANLTPVMQWGSTGNTVTAFGQASKPGGGTWAASSDLRIKNIVGPYPHGLAQLLEMLPQMFTYKGNDYTVGQDGQPDQPIHPDTTTQHIGLIAQDCEPYMPELVTTTTAFIDGVLVNDVRQLDATGVIYALVNAVAELNGTSIKNGGTIQGDLTLDGNFDNSNWRTIRTLPYDTLNINTDSLNISTDNHTDGSSSDGIYATTGMAVVSGNTGPMQFNTGNAESGNSGGITLQAGSTTTGAAGSVTISAGSASSAGGMSGNVVLSGGKGAGGAADGIVRVIGTTQFISAHSALPGFAEINVDDDGTGLWSSFVTGDTGANIWIATGLVSGYGTVASGQIAIESGSVNTSSETGPVNIGSGATIGGISGQVAIYTGSGDTSGDIHLGTGDATIRGNIRLSGLPLVDPHVADALWIDAAAGRVLKVSAG